jgi:uncharacterized protein (DUF885 family)
VPNQRPQPAARAFLDPELHAGITPENAHKLLTQDVVLSEAMAKQEVDRYTFRMPGQATMYFYEYTALLDLRREAEESLGTSFDQRGFHDFTREFCLRERSLGSRKQSVEQAALEGR